jgi:hypothetical protein
VDACSSLHSLSIRNGWNLFPNPASVELWISLSENSHIEIVNTLGQVVYSSILVAGMHKINVEHLQNGLYILNNSNTSSLRREKFIIDK